MRGFVRIALAGLAAAAAWAAAGPAGPDAQLGWRRIEGTVAQASRIPDPKRNTYADCHYTVRLDPAPGSGGRAVLLVLGAFEKRVLSPDAGLRAGQKVSIEVRPFDEMPEAFQSVQMADDIRAVDLPLLAGRGVRQVERFSDAPAPAAVAVASSARLEPVAPDPKTAAVRAERVAAERAKIERLLAAHGGWEAWFASLAPMRAGLRDQVARAPGGFLRKGSWVVGEPEPSLGLVLSDGDPYYRFALATLKTMRDEFARVGTDLVVVPVPLREAVYATKFVDRMPADGVLQPYWLKFHLDLLKQDVETLDLEPAFRAAIETNELVYIYDRHDAHPGSDGAVAAGREIASLLARYPFTAPRTPFVTRPAVYFRNAGEPYFPRSFEYACVQVTWPDGRPLEDDPRSEVLMIGDSMLTAPQGRTPAVSLGIHAARFAGFPFAYFKRVGSVPSMAGQLARVTDASLFSGRRVCVLVMAFDYFVTKDKPWWPEPFVRPRLGPAPVTPPGPDRSAVFVVGPGKGVDRLSLEPSATASGALDPRAQTCRIGLPPGLDPARAWTVSMQVASAGQAVWTTVAAGVTNGDVLVPAGVVDVTWSRPAGATGWSGFVLPAGMPAATLRGVRLWDSAGPPPDEALRPGAWMKAARFDSEADFATLAVVPAVRAGGGAPLRLERVPGARTVNLPAVRDTTGLPLRWMAVDADSDGPATVDLLADGAPAGSLRTAGIPCRMVFVLPAAKRFGLRIAGDSPEVRISRIDLLSAVPGGTP